MSTRHSPPAVPCRMCGFFEKLREVWMSFQTDKWRVGYLRCHLAPSSRAVGCLSSGGQADKAVAFGLKVGGRNLPTAGQLPHMAAL